MLQIIGNVFMITWLVFVGVHTHEWPDNLTCDGYYKNKYTCRCGAVYRSEVVTEPCPHSSDGDYLLSCALGHGEWKNGSVIEFHPELDTGFYRPLPEHGKL